MTKRGEALMGLWGKRFLYFDGAMGTLLQAKGLKPGEEPEGAPSFQREQSHAHAVALLKCRLKNHHSGMPYSFLLFTRRPSWQVLGDRFAQECLPLHGT